MEDKTQFIKLTKDLNNQQFRFLIIALLNQTPRQMQRSTPSLFSKYITDTYNCEVISNDIVNTINCNNELDKLEDICKSFNLSIADTRNMRKWLGLRDLDEVDNN